MAEKLEEFKTNIVKYRNIIEALKGEENKDKIRENSGYLTEMLTYLESESDIFRSATNTYHSARKLITDLKNLGINRNLEGALR